MLKRTLQLAMAGLIAVAFATAKPAAAVTFASFTDTGNQDWSFVNAGAGSTLVATAIPVRFFYDVTNGYGTVGETILGTLTLTAGAVANQQVVTPGTPGHAAVITDNTYLTDLTMIFTANTPVGGKTDLLNVTANYALLSGSDGGSIAAIAAQDNVGQGEAVTYSSNFLSFAGSGNNQLTVNLLSLSTPLSQNGNGFLNSFSGSSTGQFASSTPTPEASSVVSFGVLLMLGGLALLRGRKSGLKAA